MDIPKKFYKVGAAGYPVVVRNVGELKAALAELPDTLPVEHGFSHDGADVVVYNCHPARRMSHDFGPPHLELRERETDDY